MTSPLLRTFELAEAGAFDGRGLPTLIGFAPVFWEYREFPATVTLFGIAIGENEDEVGKVVDIDRVMLIELSVRDPAEQVIFFQSVRGQRQPKDDLGLPGRTQFVAQIAFEANLPGVYKVVLRYIQDDRDETYVRPMYIRRVGELLQPDNASLGS